MNALLASTRCPADRCTRACCRRSCSTARGVSMSSTSPPSVHSSSESLPPAWRVAVSAPSATKILTTASCPHCAARYSAVRPQGWVWVPICALERSNNRTASAEPAVAATCIGAADNFPSSITLLTSHRDSTSLPMWARSAFLQALWSSSGGGVATGGTLALSGSLLRGGGGGTASSTAVPGVRCRDCPQQQARYDITRKMFRGGL